MNCLMIIRKHSDNVATSDDPCNIHFKTHANYNKHMTYNIIGPPISPPSTVTVRCQAEHVDVCKKESEAPMK